MNDAIIQLFNECSRKYNGSVDRALSEIIQNIALLGLSRTDFFSHAAFYGGTALRLVHNLDRFSEDLDFSLVTSDREFSFYKYFDALQNELNSFGFEVTIEERNKVIASPIESAFIKTNTKINVIKIGIPEKITDRIHRNAVCKVKLEIDVDPPEGAEYEVKYIDDPVPFSVKVYSGPSAFAGKMEAVLCRGWKSRVKGRDWYDFAFLVRKKIPLLLSHLESRLRQREFYTDKHPLDADRCRELIMNRIMAVDLSAAKEDVLPFVNNPADLDVWSKDYFRYVLDNMTFI